MLHNPTLTEYQVSFDEALDNLWIYQEHYPDDERYLDSLYYFKKGVPPDDAARDVYMRFR